MKINALLILASVAIFFSGCQDQTAIQPSTPQPKEQVNPKSPLVLHFQSVLADDKWKEQLNDSNFTQTRKQIISTYKKRTTSIWFNDSGLSENGQVLVSELKSVRGRGLDTALFDLNNTLDKINTCDSEVQKFKAELHLTGEYMKLATYLNRGYLSRSDYLPIFEIDSIKVDLAQHLVDAAEKQSIVESLNYLEPQIPEYRHLQTALSKYVAMYPVTEFTATVTSFKEDSAQCIRDCASALIGFGYLDSIEAGNDSLVDLAIKKFQLHNGLNQDGKPGKYTVKAFKRSNLDRFTEAQSALLKLRWNKNQDRKSYLYVNIPSYTMKIAEGGKYVKEHRAVVGKSWTKTPELEGEMEYFIINPRWHVPYSISSTELLNKARKDSTYLSRNGYVVSKGGSRVNSRSVDWDAVSTSSFGYKISQNAGGGNALGRIKFIFPNDENIYMHDTPSRSLFANDIRAYSHGCVRLHNPVELAEYLAEKQELSMHRDSIQVKIDQRLNRKVNLQEKVKVFIEYYLAGTNIDGEIQFYLNVYQKDLDLLNAIKNGGAVPADELSIVE